MNKERMSYWMAPNEEFLDSTGCFCTGRVETFHMMPRREWNCPNEYPGLPLDPVYNYVRWWERPTLTSQPRPVPGLGDAREDALSRLNQFTRPMAEQFLDSGVVTDPMEAVCLVDRSACPAEEPAFAPTVMTLVQPTPVTEEPPAPNYALWGGLGVGTLAVLGGGAALAWWLFKGRTQNPGGSMFTQWHAKKIASKRRVRPALVEAIYKAVGAAPTSLIPAPTSVSTQLRKERDDLDWPMTVTDILFDLEDGGFLDYADGQGWYNPR